MFAVTMTLVIVLLWLVSAAAIWLVAKRSTVWRLSFAFGITALAIALTVDRLQPEINHLTGIPNVATMLSHVFGAYGAAGLAIFILYIRRDPPPSAVPIQMIVATIASAGIITFWSLAPIHKHDYGRFDQIPITVTAWPLVAYNATFCVYLGAIMVLAAISAADNAVQAPSLRIDPGRKLGGIAFCIATSIGAVYLLGCNLGRVMANATGHHDIATQLTAIGRGLLPVALVGICLGRLLWTSGHVLLDYTQAIHTIVTVGPLWRSVRKRRQVFTLQAPPTTRHSVIIRAQRMRTGIIDALHLTLLPGSAVESDSASRYEQIVLAMLHPDPDGTIPAISLVSGDDETITLELARAYRHTLRADASRRPKEEHAPSQVH